MNEDNVAPWKVDVGGMDLDDGCAEPEEGEGAGAGCGGRDRGGAGARLGMNDVTTATGCAVSRRRARIFWERPRALMLLAARSKEDRRFVGASATDMISIFTLNQHQCRFRVKIIAYIMLSRVHPPSLYSNTVP